MHQGQSRPWSWAGFRELTQQCPPCSIGDLEDEHYANKTFSDKSGRAEAFIPTTRSPAPALVWAPSLAYNTGRVLLSQNSNQGSASSRCPESAEQQRQEEKERAQELHRTDRDLHTSLLAPVRRTGLRATVLRHHQLELEQRVQERPQSSRASAFPQILCKVSSCEIDGTCRHLLMEVAEPGLGGCRGR